MIGRIGPVTDVSAVGRLAGRQGLPHRPDPAGRRPAAWPRTRPGSTCRRPSAPRWPAGTWLNAATDRYPAVVLGANGGAAARHRPADRRRRRCWSAACGSPSSASWTRSPLAPGARLGRAGRLAGRADATSASTATRRPSTPGRRSTPVEAVQAVLGATANPEAPERGDGVPAVGRAGRPGGHRRGVHRPAARARRGGPAGRRGRGGQHDGDLGAGTAGGDRPAPVARAPPGARSGCSSSPSRCCCPRSAASAGVCLGIAVTTAYASYQDWPTTVPLWATARRRRRDPGHRWAGRPLPGHPGRPAVPDRGAGHPVTDGHIDQHGHLNALVVGKAGHAVT